MSLNFGKSPRMLPHHLPTIQSLHHSLLEKKRLKVAVLRLDQVHPEVSGNKFYKLKYNLKEARLLGKNTLLTFGGAYSNHIYATATAANLAGFQSIGIIRGEDADPDNATLLHARAMGMQLEFISRAQYREKSDPGFLESLARRFGDFYLIPEGGTNELAVKGTGEILSPSTETHSHICVSIGTGGTLAGLAKSIQNYQHLLGFSSLKGDFIHQEISTLLDKYGIAPQGKVSVRTDYHMGGYGKHTPELIRFMNWFYDTFHIPLDPIYTGKMAFGVWDLIEKNEFPTGSSILMIHTGGLQGNAGFEAKTGIHLPTL